MIYGQFHEPPDDIFTSETCSRNIVNKKVCGSPEWTPVYVHFSCRTM